MKHRFSNGVVLILLSVLGILFLMPIIVTVTNSFMPKNDIIAHYETSLSLFDLMNGVREKFIQMSLIPSQITVSQYEDVLINQPTFLGLLANTLKITIPVVLGNIIVSTLTAYGFTLWQWRHKEKIFFIYIVVMLMPLQAVLVPNYIIADKLGTATDYLAIILPGIFAPFGTFLLRQTMLSLPKVYFEAAQIEGAGSFHIFWYIVLPQMKSGITALSMLVFIEYWNVVEQVIIFIKEAYKKPLSVFLSTVPSENINLIFALSTVYMLLPLWFLSLSQNDLKKGIELSGIK